MFFSIEAQIPRAGVYVFGMLKSTTIDEDHHSIFHIGNESNQFRPQFLLNLVGFDAIGVDQ